MTPIEPFTDEDISAVEAAEAAVKTAEDRIAKAKQAGFDTEAWEQELLQDKQVLERIRSVYFPELSPRRKR